LSKVLKAYHASLTQQAYQVPVAPIRSQADPVIDLEAEQLKSAAQLEAERIRGEAYMEAAQLIQNAREDAQGIMEAERSRVHAILESEVAAAKQQGYAEGYAEAREVVEAEYAERFAEVERLYLQAVEERKRYLAEAEPMIVDMACAVARKITHRDLAERDWVVDVVRTALEHIHDAGKIEVRVHPDDFELVHASREGLRKEVPGQTELLVIPDRGVAPGGCVVHTAFGNIDARIDTQLEEVRKALQEVAASPES